MTATPQPTTMPSTFVGVGGPRQMWDDPWNEQLLGWARSMPRPRAILLFSAHWAQRPLVLGATRTVPLVYDYYGFPPHFYEVQYDAPPAPEVAERVVDLLADALPIHRSDRGLDHGAFIGLKGMYPEADVPVLTASLPTFHPGTLFELGRRLAPLRQEGVMVMGAGLLNHSSQNPTANAAFDGWVADTLDKRDVESLLAYREIAPGVREALPTVEHFVPLFVAYGAAYDDAGSILSGVEGFTERGGSKRSLQFN